MSNLTNKVWQMLLDGKSNEDILKVCSISTLKKIRAKFNRDKANGNLKQTVDKFPQKSRAKSKGGIVLDFPYKYGHETALPKTMVDKFKKSGVIDKIMAKDKEATPANYPTPGLPDLKFTENFEKGEKTYDVKSYEIHTLEDLVKWSEIDMDKFECVSFTANRWGNAKWECTQCKGVFRPISKKTMSPDDISELFKDIVIEYKGPDTILPVAQKKDENICIMPIADLHFGALAIKEEIGQENNLELTRKNLLTSTSHHLGTLVPKSIDKIIIPILGDFYNTDTVNNTTTAGTFQEESSSWKNTSRKGIELMIETIDMCRSAAMCDVKVIICNGNHDMMRSFALGLVLEAFYRDNPSVEIDNSHSTRKYDTFGNSVFGFGHGDTKANADYLGIMCEEAPEKFANAKHRTMMVGHLHHKVTEEKPGIVVRRLGSLTSSDAWHRKMGYQSVRSSQSYIVNIESGIVSNSTFYIK